MNLNYSVSKVISLLNQSFSYPMMKVIIGSSIVLFVLLVINKQMDKYMVLGINLIIMVAIIYYYHGNLIASETFRFIMHNISFYFLNSILYLIVISISFFKVKKKLVLQIIYSLNFILLIFSLFMTYYVHNDMLITLGNIYPMIVIGNYLYFIFYGYIVMMFIKRRVLTRDK